MPTLRDRVTALGSSIRQVAAEHGARNVRIFGSVARGQERDASDVDFLVSLDRGRTLLDLARLELRLEAMVGASVDVVTESGLREPVRSEAVRDAVPI